MFTVKKKHTRLTGIGPITEILRQIFPLRTFSICSLEVDFPPVSPVTFLNVVLVLQHVSGCGWIHSNREMCLCAISVYAVGNVHVYSNGRMRFGHQPRHERQEQQREVRAQSSKIIRGFVQMFYL